MSQSVMFLLLFLQVIKDERRPLKCDILAVPQLQLIDQ